MRQLSSIPSICQPSHRQLSFASNSISLAFQKMRSDCGYGPECDYRSMRHQFKYIIIFRLWREFMNGCTKVMSALYSVSQCTVHAGRTQVRASYREKHVDMITSTYRIRSFYITTAVQNTFPHIVTSFLSYISTPSVLVLRCCAVDNDATGHIRECAAHSARRGTSLINVFLFENVSYYELFFIFYIYLLHMYIKGMHSIAEFRFNVEPALRFCYELLYSNFTS